jgi:GNAT superfamily N-acetyltransferase
MTSLPLDILPETPDCAEAIEKLHERGFGPGRFARTAFRLREGGHALPGLNFIARVGTLLVGSVRLSPIRIGGAPALLLGPLAVDPAFTGRGIGTGLLKASLNAARASGHKLVLLARPGRSRPAAGCRASGRRVRARHGLRRGRYRRLKTGTRQRPSRAHVAVTDAIRSKSPIRPAKTGNMFSPRTTLASASRTPIQSEP